MWMDRKMTYQTCWISQAGKTGQQVYVRFSLTAVILWTIIVNVSAASGQKIDVTTVEPLDMTNTPGSVIMGQTYSPSGRPEPSAGRQEQTTSSSTSEVILDSGRIERNVTCTPQLTETCPVSGGLLEVHCWLKGSRGQITWTEPSDSCWRHVHWHIASPSDQMGIVLDLNSLHSGLWEAFDIFTVDQTTRQRVIIPRSYKESPFIPRLIHNSHVVVLISTRPNAFSRPFSFSLSYYAHPIDRMPILVPVPGGSEAREGVQSLHMYNCSHPYSVPESLRCDLIQQCEGGEDEPRDCLYRSYGGCGDWIPAGKRCLQITYAASAAAINDSHLLAAEDETNGPQSASSACEAEFGAELAGLPDPRHFDLVAEITRRSGRIDKRSRVVLHLEKAAPASRQLSHLYTFFWQWGGHGGPFDYDHVSLQRHAGKYRCMALVVRTGLPRLEGVPCISSPSLGRVCMKPREDKQTHASGIKHAKLRLHASSSIARFPTRRCSDGSLTHTFLECPQKFLHPSPVATTANTLLFPCTLGRGIHYTLVCDGNRDCADGSDEKQCSLGEQVVFARKKYFICSNNGLVPASSRCDGVRDCFDDSDERGCISCPSGMFLCGDFGCKPTRYKLFGVCMSTGSLRLMLSSPPEMPPPAIVELDGFGVSSLRKLDEGENCPETHFLCPEYHCMPTFLLNNGEKDCPQGEDESIVTTDVECSGFYRCLDSAICVHPQYVCDGIPHCPNKDDERFCNLKCPANCTCEGHAFRCHQMFDPQEYLEVRYLDLSGIEKPRLEGVNVMMYVQFINLSSCGLDTVTLRGMRQLKTLDLSSNLFHSFSSLELQQLTGLLFIDISRNPFSPTLDHTFSACLKRAGMAKLNRLVMKDIGFTGVDSGIFEHVTKLDVLDIRGNPLSSFKQDVFADLTELSDLLTDDPRLCCDFYHEYTQLMECVSPRNELSSCSDLLKGDFFRVVLWGLSLLAVIGNVSVLIYRLCVETGGTSSLPYRMLVSNMAMSDLLMGVYMLIIGAADTRFRDVYVAEEENWKRSNTCKTAGFLAFVSSEVSAFVICLITIDRMLVLRFPFSSRLRLTKRSVWLACGAAWGIGLTLAAVPLFKSDWQFYGQNGLCLPLPITRLNFKGQQYAFDIFIILNFVIFLLIGGGQVFIFWTIRDSAKKADKDSWRKTTAVARRLFLIVITDFLCWFPIGLMGLLATYGGAPIPDVVYVWASIVILPLNSAFNPFLYTLTTLLQRRGERRRAARVEMTIRRLHSEILSWPRSKIVELVLYIHKSNLIERKKLQQLLGISPQQDVVNTSRIVSRDHGQVSEPNAPQEMLKDGLASCGVDVEFGKGCNSVCKTCVTEVTESSEQSCQRDGELRTCKVHVHSADVHVDGPL